MRTRAAQDRRRSSSQLPGHTPRPHGISCLQYIAKSHQTPLCASWLNRIQQATTGRPHLPAVPPVRDAGEGNLYSGLRAGTGAPARRPRLGCRTALDPSNFREIDQTKPTISFVFNTDR
jgi:hypothetical protein